MIMNFKFKKKQERRAAPLLGQSNMPKAINPKLESLNLQVSLSARALSLIFCILVFAGCSESDQNIENSAIFTSFDAADQSLSNAEYSKGDDHLGTFPAEQDLVLIVPNYRAVYPILENDCKC